MSNIVAFTNAVSRARSTVIALHCSGASGRQWRRLAEAIEHRFAVIAPDLIGCGENAHWDGREPFRLSNEAAAVVALIDACAGPVHLVGHSYGGGVALRVAVERPTRVASLSLYEPTPFHVLKAAGPDGLDALGEIRAVASAVTRAVANGSHAIAAREFVDYWNGTGAWSSLRPELQSDLVRWVPKAALDFSALIEERIPLAAYRRLRASVLLLRGERSPMPARLIAQKLAQVMKPRVFEEIAEADHMGPFTHAEIVNRTIVEHLIAVDSRQHTGETRQIRFAQAA